MAKVSGDERSAQQIVAALFKPEHLKSEQAIMLRTVKILTAFIKEQVKTNLRMARELKSRSYDYDQRLRDLEDVANVYSGEHEDRKWYVRGNIVEFEGGIYRCKHKTDATPGSSDYWHELSDPGSFSHSKTYEPPKDFGEQFTGLWREDKKYKHDQYVSFLGMIWRCKRPGGGAPQEGAHWAVVMKVGEENE